MDDDYQKNVTITDSEYNALLAREDMSGYQWHDAEKEKPSPFEDVLLLGSDNDIMVGWFDNKDGLFSAYNDLPNMGPADVKMWATLYIPKPPGREEKK